MSRQLLLPLALAVALAGVALATGSAGFVDSGFGTNGVAVLPAQGVVFQVLGFQVLGQPDGLIAVGHGPSGVVIDGQETNDWQIRRLLSDGSADPTFGTGGVARFFGDTPGTSDEARAGYLDAQGRIWVGGRGRIVTGTSGKGRKQTTTYGGGAFVLCLNADGVRDASFGDQGAAQLFPAMGSVQALVALPDGDVLVVGRGAVQTAGGGGGKGKKGGGGGGASSSGIVVARLSANGTLDTSYGDSGFARVDLDPTSDADYSTLHGAALQSGNRLVILTVVSGDLAGPRVGLIRLSANGTRDTSFADPLPGVYLRSMAVAADDRILVAGHYLGDLYVLRYDSDGALDDTYGTNGAVSIDTSPAAFQTEPLGGHALHLAGADVLLACVEWVDQNAPVDGFHGFAIRLDAGGGLITSYGPSGDGQSERLLALASFDAVHMPNGDLVFSGQSYASASLGDQAVGRLAGP